jgi:hypothetical protein
MKPSFFRRIPDLICGAGCGREYQLWFPQRLVIQSSLVSHFHHRLSRENRVFSRPDWSSYGRPSTSQPRPLENEASFPHRSWASPSRHSFLHTNRSSVKILLLPLPESLSWPPSPQCVDCLGRLSSSSKSLTSHSLRTWRSASIGWQEPHAWVLFQHSPPRLPTHSQSRFRARRGGGPVERETHCVPFNVWYVGTSTSNKRLSCFKN